MNRRSFLHVAVGGSAGAYLLAACGPAVAPAPAPPTNAPTSAPAKPAATIAPAATAAPATTVPAATPTVAPAQVSTAASKPAATGGLPTYIPAQTAKPDLPLADPGLQAGYFSYPKQLVKAVVDVPGSGGDVTAVVNTTMALPPALDENASWQAVNKALNANMKILLVPSTDYATKAAALMAGNDLPDLFYLGHNLTVRGIPQFLKSSHTDLTPFVAGDAIKDYPNLAALPTSAWAQVTYDGAIYGVPVVRGAYNNISYMNEGMFQAIGVGEQGPKDGDDFKRILQALNHPQSNQFAIAALPPGYGLDYVGRGDIPLLARFNAPNNWAVDSSGKFTKDIETPQFKTALAYVRDLYAAGLFFPDPGISQTTMRTNFLGSRIATITTGWNTNGSLLWDPGKAQNPVVRPRALRPFAMDATKKPIWHQSQGFNGLTALKKGTPERTRELLRIMNFMAAPFGSEEYQLLNFGVQGVDFEFDAKGNPSPTARGKAEQTLTVGWQYLAQPMPVLFDPNDSDFVKNTYADEQAMSANMIADPTVGLYSETDISMTGTLSQRFFGSIGEIVMGQRPLTDLDQLLQAWRSAGGDQMRNEFQQAYGARR
jgi:putative aldouronate transport system substrate-binding protein